MDARLEPISPELVLVCPELRQLALMQLADAAARSAPLPEQRRAEPPQAAASESATRRVRLRRLLVAGLAYGAARLLTLVAVFAVEVALIVAAVFLVKLMGVW
jgi:hypothetical protein